jgi:hypothetical protein
VGDTTITHYNKNTFQAFQLFRYWLFEFVTGSSGNVKAVRVPFEPEVPDIVFEKVEE